MQQVDHAASLEYGLLVGGDAPDRAPHNSTTPLKLPLSESTPIRPSAAAAKVGPSHQPGPGQGEGESAAGREGKEYSRRNEQRTLNLQASMKQIDNIESRWDHDSKSESKSDRPPAAGAKHGSARVGEEPEQLLNLTYVEPGSAAKPSPLRVVTANTATATPQQRTNTHAAVPETPSPQGKGRAVEYNLHLVGADNRDGEFSVEALLAHSSDTQVKPILGNKTIEVIEKPEFKESALSFDVLGAADLSRLSTQDLEFHLTQVFYCWSLRRAMSKYGA